MNLKKKKNNEKSLVLVSGGQDSATCLFWALKKFKTVEAISFYYAQKHSKEIDVAESLCNQLKINHKKVDISFLKDLVISNLFDGKNDINKSHVLNKKVPSSFVPYRNMIFLTLAAAWASTIDTKHIVIGVCETDYSGICGLQGCFYKIIAGLIKSGYRF